MGHQIADIKRSLSMNEVSSAGTLNPVCVGTELIKKVMEIERHGNLSVNLRNGEVEIVRPLDFVARKATDLPSAAFADTRQADCILRDIADLSRIFTNVPIFIEGNTRALTAGTPEFWQTLALNRANLATNH